MRKVITSKSSWTVLIGTYFLKLDGVFIGVLRTWPQLSSVLLLSQVLNEHFGLVVSLSDRE